jgi:hypothetical protein
MGARTPKCNAQRIDAFNHFLDSMAEVDPSLDRPRALGHYEGQVRPGDVRPTRKEGTKIESAAGYDLAVGPRSARLIFNLGDGQLTAAKVSWALQTARRIRTSFPVKTEDDVVGSAYYNAKKDQYVPYTHPDHFAVQQALFDVDQGLPGPQWGRTTPADPNRRRKAFVDNDTYCALLCTTPMPVDPWGSPTATRRGRFQQNYGWLAFTAEGSSKAANSFWPASYDPTESVFSQAQDFWKRFGNEGRKGPAQAQGIAGSGKGIDRIVLIPVAVLALIAFAQRRRRIVRLRPPPAAS